jgi:hypothetical protein
LTYARRFPTQQVSKAVHCFKTIAHLLVMLPPGGISGALPMVA